MDAGSGDRLRAFVEMRWSRKRGGIRGLCREMNVAPETAYGWFRGDNDPSLGALATMAAILGVKRWEIVAAIDGDEAVGYDEAGRDQLRELVESILDERLGPRRPAPRARAAGAD
jgi:transcriptional regulator with XRE-family HTH domain